MSMKKLKLNWGQRLMISRGFPVALGKRTRPGGSESHMFYAFKCEKHGIVENNVIKCPKCKEDKP